MGDEYALEAPLKGFKNDREFVEFEQHHHGWTACPECNTEFERKIYNQVYCAPKCARASRAERESKAKRDRRANPEIDKYRACIGLGCTAIFMPRRKDSKYCSRKCYFRTRNALHPKTPIFRKCKECGEEFTPKPNQVYCDKRCQMRASNRRYQKRHPDKTKAAKAKWRAENPEYAARYQRIVYRRDPEKWRAMSKRYYDEHRDEILERQRKQRRA